MTRITNPKVAEILRLVIAYYNKVKEISYENPPPGPNASSGVFVLKVIDESQYFIEQLQRDTGDARANDVASVFEHIVRHTMITFRNQPTYNGSAVDFWKLNKDVLGSSVAIIANAIFISLGVGSWGYLAGSIATFIESVSDENVSKGNHANGWIAAAFSGDVIRGTDVNIPLRLTKRGEEGDDGRIVAEVLSNVNNQLKSIDNGKHKPWLNSEWQIKLTIIYALAGEAFRCLLPEYESRDDRR